MAQFARPSGTITQGIWTTNAAGADLHNAIDEATRSDTDFITSSFNSTGLCEISLSPLTDPELSSGHIVRYAGIRAKTNKDLTLVVRLIQGPSTTIASWSHTNPDSTATYNQTLTGGQTDNITGSGYADLRLQFDVTVNGGGGQYADVYWAEFEVPNAVVNQNVNPTAVSLTTSAVAPSVSLGGVSVSPASLSLTTSVQAPAVAPGEVTTAPSAVGLSTSVIAPSITLGGVSVSPSPISLAISTQAPTVGNAVTVNPSSLTLTTSIPTPSIGGATIASPSPVSLGISTQDPTTAVGGVSVSPNAESLALSVPAPEVGTATTVSPTPLVLSMSTTAPSVSLGAVSVSPSPEALTTSVPTPSITTGTQVTPSPLSLSLSIPVPDTAADQAVSPASIVVTLSIPTPTASMQGGDPAAPATTAYLDGTTLTLTTVAFDSASGMTHTKTHWQVQPFGGDWSSPYYDLVSGTDLTTHNVDISAWPANHYEARARHHGVPT